MRTANARLSATLLGLFVLSGFAGLIYQSVWSHYLGLTLGHAAYAQTLVLAIFMGGMALGAAWASRVRKRLGSPVASLASRVFARSLPMYSSIWTARA